MMHSSILHQTGPRWQGENWDFEFLILDVECIKFGRLSLRNSEPASAGDISIAMGWSSTVRVDVDREADEAPQSGETPSYEQKIFWNPWNG